MDEVSPEEQRILAVIDSAITNQMPDDYDILQRIEWSVNNAWPTTQSMNDAIYQGVHDAIVELVQAGWKIR